MSVITDLPGADQTVIDYAIAKAEGRRRAKEVILEVLAEVDLPINARRRLLAELRARGVM